MSGVMFQAKDRAQLISMTSVWCAIIKRNIKKKIKKIKSAWPSYYRDKHLEGCVNFNAMNMVRECFVRFKASGEIFLKSQINITIQIHICLLMMFSNFWGM